MELNLNDMTLEQVLDYCADNNLLLLNILIDCDGIDKVREILLENNRI